MISKSVSSDGAVLFWSAGRIRRDVAEAAFEAEGCAHFLPQCDSYGALKRACMKACADHSVGGGNRVRPYTLSGNPSAAGVEIRSIIPGLTRNDMPFQFSAALVQRTDGSVGVEVLDVDTCQSLDSFRHNVLKVEKEIDAQWREECQWISANDMTHAITELVRSNHGFLLRNEGVVWYISSDLIGPYERISDALSPHGVSMQAVYFYPDVNEKLLEHVRDELVRRQQAVFDGHVEALQDLAARGGKTRSNGRRTRVEEWVAAHNMLTHFRDLLGAAFKPLAKAAAHAREKIGEAAFDEFA